MIDLVPAVPLLPAEILPQDADRARLIGRVWSKAVDGPVPVLYREGHLLDLSTISPTSSGLLEKDDLIRRLDEGGPDIGPLSGFLDGSLGTLLAPVDLQAVKAAGVTFAGSMLERVIEEHTRGNPEQAAAVRSRLMPVLGEKLTGLVPGSEQAMAVKALLVEMGLWSQYLEVGIGADAEIFTKAQPMSSVGCGALAGLHPKSEWNNPEPEVVLAIRSDGAIVGATLGNDVNLRDIEGRSALLLGKAKDNNASCSIGPFIRLFDAAFTLDTVRNLEVSLTVTGDDGFVMEGVSRMSAISRDPSDLAAQLLNPNHQYPDGATLFLGTMFAPVKDRRGPNQGFTHEIGDLVEISAPELGRLVNRMARCADCPPWTFGTGALLRNLARRGLL